MSFIINSLTNWLFFNSNRNSNNNNKTKSIRKCNNTYSNIISRNFNEIVGFQSLSYSCLTYIANYLDTDEFVRYVQLFKSKDLRSLMMLCKTSLLILPYYDNLSYDMVSLSRYIFIIVINTIIIIS